MDKQLKAILRILLLFFISISGFSQTQLIPWWSSLASFEKPIGLVKAKGFESVFFVVEQRGIIYRVEEDSKTTKRSVFLDLSEKVSQQGFETGLLGLAFHPQFAQNGRFFISYTTGQEKQMVSHISELGMADLAKWKVNPASLTDLITVSQPYQNHNGGALLFGLDGYLYFSWGDGGSAGDPQNNSQNLNSLLGKIHRIDIDKKSAGQNYGIPSDNPFVGKDQARPEIFAYGLRNVWQMQFDPATGKLWAGDVGQNAFEEIDVVEKGKNYGWRVMEAKSVYASADPKPENLEPPVVNYSQKNGDKSVTGGFVYHGDFSNWQNKYVYGDFITGCIWLFDPKDGKNDLLLDRKSPPVQISCFGQTQTGDVLVVSHNDGVVYRLSPNGQ